MAGRTLNPLYASDMATSLALGLGLCAPVMAQQPVDSANEKKPDIVVTGHREDTGGLDRITTLPVDTPQIISTISREELERRGISNLSDALRNVAGLTLGAGETSFQGNNAILRGFTTRNDLFVDNARDYGYYFRDTFNDASIDVIKGPASILFGRGSTGGVIHRVSKVPVADNFLNAEGQVGFADTRRITLDGNLAGLLGEGSALRLNAMAHHSGVADRDAGFSERWGVAPSLALSLGEGSRLTLGYLHQEENNRPDYGIPWFAGTRADPGFPAPVNRANYYGFTDDRLDTVVNLLTGRLVHALNETTSLRAQIRYSNNTRDFRYSEAVIPAGTPRNAPLDTVTVGRNLFQGASRDRFFQSQLELETSFTTGVLRHTIVTGVEGGREATDPVYTTNFGVPTTSLADPVTISYDSTPNSFVRLRGAARSNFQGLFLIDTIAIGERWLAIAGVRWDRFHTDYDSVRFAANGNPDRTSAVSRTDSKPSVRGALVYKPNRDASIYVSYATSFNPSGEGIESLISAGRSVAEANQNLDPETSFTVELGTKWQVLGGRLTASAALFRIEKDNVRVPDPANPGFNILGGRQRVDGAEFELGGEPLPGLHIRAAGAWLDSRTIRSSPNGPLVGEPLLITPRWSGSIATSYAITPRLEIGANLVGASRRLGQNTPGSYLVAGGYAVVDASISYRFSEHTIVRLLVNNIGDRLYYDQLHPFHVIPGAGRTALLSVGTGF